MGSKSLILKRPWLRTVLAGLTSGSIVALSTAAPAVAAPANDNFADRATVGPALPVDTTGTTVEATTEAGEPAHYTGPFGPARSVWYDWTPGADVRARIDVCALDPPMQVSVYTGTAVNALTTVVDGNNGSCRATFDAAASTSYKVAVFSASEAPFALNIHVLSPPANDDFDDAQAIGPGLPISASGTNADATSEAGEPSMLGASGPRASVWYLWTPSVSAPVTVDVCTGPPPSVVAVYTGSAVNALTQIAGSGAGCSLAFNASSGIPYRIAMDSFVDEGAFDLNILDAPVSVNPPTMVPSQPPAAQAQTPKKCKKGLKLKKGRCVKKKRKRRR